jgi:hypothetical protein
VNQKKLKIERKMINNRKEGVGVDLHQIIKIGEIVDIIEEDLILERKDMINIAIEIKEDMMIIEEDITIDINIEIIEMMKNQEIEIMIIMIEDNKEEIMINQEDSQ